MRLPSYVRCHNPFTTSSGHFSKCWLMCKRRYSHSCCACRDLIWSLVLTAIGTFFAVCCTCEFCHWCRYGEYTLQDNLAVFWSKFPSLLNKISNRLSCQIFLWFDVCWVFVFCFFLTPPNVLGSQLGLTQFKINHIIKHVVIIIKHIKHVTPSGCKKTEDGSTTNIKIHGDADNLFFFFLLQSRIWPSEISSFKSNDWLLVDGICGLLCWTLCCTHDWNKAVKSVIFVVVCGFSHFLNRLRF